MQTAYHCVSSHCVRLSMAAGYVRLSRVISGNFARRFQCIYMQKNYSPVLIVSYFFLFVRYIITLRLEKSTTVLLLIL